MGQNAASGPGGHIATCRPLGGLGPFAKQIAHFFLNKLCAQLKILGKSQTLNKRKEIFQKNKQSTTALIRN
jgi:hypothetical protein